MNDTERQQSVPLSASRPERQGPAFPQIGWTDGWDGMGLGKIVQDTSPLLLAFWDRIDDPKPLRRQGLR